MPTLLEKLQEDSRLRSYTWESSDRGIIGVSNHKVIKIAIEPSMSYEDLFAYSIFLRYDSSTGYKGFLEHYIGLYNIEELIRAITSDLLSIYDWATMQLLQDLKLV